MDDVCRSDKIASTKLKLKKFRDAKAYNTQQPLQVVTNSVPLPAPAAYFTPSTVPNDAYNAYTAPTVHTAFQAPGIFATPTAPVVPSPSLNSRPLADYFTPSNGTVPDGSNDWFSPKLEYTLPPSYNQSPRGDAPPTVTMQSPAPVWPTVPPHASTPVIQPSEYTEIYQSDGLVQTESNGPVYVEPRLEEGQSTDIFDSAPTPATEKMLQLSQQLNGLLQTSEKLTSAFLAPSVDEMDLPIEASPRSEPIPTNEFPYQGSDFTGHSPGRDGESGGSGLRFPPPSVSRPWPHARSGTPTSTHSAVGGNTYTRELEERNVELAALLEKQSRAHEQSVVKITLLQDQVTKLTHEAVSERTSLESASQRDSMRAQEQIRVHAQTIGALVAEKMELQAKVAHSERLSQERGQEINLLNDRIRQQRQQSSEFERSSVQLKSQLDKTSSSSTDLLSQLERLKSELKRERLNRQTVDNELQEAYSRLTAQAHEMSQLELSVGELKGQLELAQVYANQLTSSSTGGENGLGKSGSVEGWLTAERACLTERIQELEASALQANKDRGRMESQYKTFVVQLEQQSTELRTQLSEANKTSQDAQSLLEQKQRELRQCEDDLADLKVKLDLADTKLSDHGNRAEEREQGDVSSIAVGTADASRSNESDVRRIAQLEELTMQQQRDLERQTDQVVQLKQSIIAAETTLREKDALLADREVVLQTASSERTALSRAMEQNRTLKQQLAELQDAFVNISNNNMVLTTELQQEQHALRESSTIQHDYRGQLERLQEHCAKREVEYTALMDAYEEMHRRPEIQQTTTSLMDPPVVESVRVVLTEAPSEIEEKPTVEETHPPNEELLNQLAQCQTTIQALMTRAEAVDSLMHRFHLTAIWLESRDPDPSVSPGIVGQTRSSQSAKLDSLDPLECYANLERNLRLSVQRLEREVVLQADQNRQHAAVLMELPKLDEWRALQVAHTQLEAKFLTSMDKLSSLTEECAQSEAIVAQLEMEASSIGEYVTLFTHRRITASRRSQAREQLLARLLHDRRRLRSRLMQVSKNVLGQETLSDERENGANGEEEESPTLNPPDASTIVTQLQQLIEEISPTDDEQETEAGYSLLNDEDADGMITDPILPGASTEVEQHSDRASATTGSSPNTIEQLCKQALQHDCPNCQCCSGTLLDV